MKKRIISLMLSATMFCGMLVCGQTLDINAATLSTAEKKQFTKYLNDHMEVTEYGINFISDENGIMYGPTFSLCDVNQDGRQDLIVTGALGLRTMTFSEVYMHAGNKYVTIPYAGTITGVGKKGIRIETDDYEMAGAIRYYDESIYNISSKGVSKIKIQHWKETMFYDIDTDTAYDSGKVLSNSYFKDGKKTTKAKYQATRKNYKFSKVKWYTLSPKNVKKYLK